MAGAMVSCKLFAPAALRGGARTFPRRAMTDKSDSHLFEERVSTEAAYDGRFLKIRNDTVRLPNGNTSTREYVVHPGAVVVIPLLDDGRVLLERQFRYPHGRDFIELPAGKLEPSEPHLETAKRELLEETGYVAGRLMPLGRPLECAYSTIERHAFLAVDCVRDRAQALDETEFIDVVEKPIEDFVAQLREGACTDPEVGWMGLYELGCLRASA